MAFCAGATVALRPERGLLSQRPQAAKKAEPADVGPGHSSVQPHPASHFFLGLQQRAQSNDGDIVAGIVALFNKAASRLAVNHFSTSLAAAFSAHRQNRIRCAAVDCS